MSEEKDTSALDPKSTPGELKERKLPSVRRINNMPLILGVGAVSLIMVLFIYVVVDRAEQQKRAQQAPVNSEEGEQVGVVSSALSFNELVGGIGDGEIPSLSQPEPEPAQAESKAPEKQQPREAEIVVNAPKPAPKVELKPKAELKPDPLTEQQRNQIAQRKAQVAASAIFAKTSVDYQPSDAGEQIIQRNEERLDALDEYRERLLALQSGSGASGLGGLFGDEEGPNTEATNRAFLESGDNDWRLDGERLAGERYTVKTGGIIPAVMISGINSDLPGQVVAQVSENVYDTASGYDLLIPQGARLIGSYNSDVLFGQSRVMLRWDRVVFPDSSTLDLQGMAGADQMGYSGFKDKVNNHYWRIFGNAFLLSLISAGYQQAIDTDNNNNINSSTTAEEQIAIQAAEQFSEVGSELVRKNLNIKPTIEIRPGYRFNVMINKDMVFGSDYRALALK